MRTLKRALIGTALLAAGGCVTWPYDTAGYYGDAYDPYTGVYESRRSHSFDYGLYYGRPFYTNYGAYPPGYYYDPRFLGGVVRPVPRPAPVAPPPAAEPPPEAVAQPVRPRDWTPPPPRQPPAQPEHRAVPQSAPVRPALPAVRAPERNDTRSQRPHRTMPQ
ncbi:MAG: hypothetical protein H0W33_09525 [Gammaproteobacteria bacterium]|nr:hypothetical protein [Gammaproteobacteria bacterium]